jgi:hypothetical protein
MPENNDSNAANVSRLASGGFISANEARVLWTNRGPVAPDLPESFTPIAEVRELTVNSVKIDRIQIHPPHSRGLVARVYFPGLTPENIEALPREMYRNALNGTLRLRDLRAWKQQREIQLAVERERAEQQEIDRAVEQWRRDKLNPTPLPDEIDRFFEPRQT